MKNIKEFTTSIEEFISYLIEQKKISSHTQRAYRADLMQFAEYWQELNEQYAIPTQFTQALEQYLTHLKIQAIEKRSVARKLSCFSSYIRFLASKNIIIEIEIKRPTFSRKLPSALSLEKLCPLLDIHHEALPTRFPYRDKAIIELLYATGITSSELVRITINDIDIKNKAIRIVGKKNKIRTVFFGTIAQERLENYLKFERRAASRSYEPFFLNHRNEQLTTRSIQRICSMFKNLLELDGELTPHTLRHSFATHLIENGTDKKDLKEFLGYSALLSTEQYAHVTPKSKNKRDVSP